MTQVRKQLHQRVARLKTEVSQGNTAGLSDFLRAVTSSEALTVFREQKVLLKIARAADYTEVGHLYRQAADRLCGSAQRVQEEINYLEYLNIVREASAALTAGTDEALRRMPPCTPDELVELAHTFLVGYVKQTYTAFTDLIQGTKELGQGHQPATTSAAHETLFHEMNGKLNDGAWAVTRALNACVAKIPTARRSGRRKGPPKLAYQPFRNLVALASQQEAIEYAVDMVSFGEWSVDAVARSPVPTVTFGLIDPVLLRARMVGIKRSVVWQSLDRPRVDRFLREVLRPAIPAFTSVFAPATLANGSLESLHQEMDRLLDMLDTEDDLLVAAADGHADLRSEYMAAVDVRWYARLARHVQNRADGSSFLQADFPEVPTYRLARFFGRSEADVRTVYPAIRRQARTLPVRHRRELLRNPLFAMPDDTLRLLPTFDASVWPAAVRAAQLNKREVGNRYGGVWERFIADGFQQAGWTVIGRGIKLRDAGRTPTDIDLLVAKHDLALACQIKAMAGAGEDGYSH